MWTALMLVGCGDGHNVIYLPLADDSADEIPTNGNLLGADTSFVDLSASYVTGSTLRFVVTRPGEVPTAWTAEVLSPEIVELVSALPGDDGIEIELLFLRAGTTELFIFDGSGTVIDVQRISVRDPVDAELVSWDDRSAGGDEPIGDVLHVVPDTHGSAVIYWLDEKSVSLSGGGITEIDVSDVTPGVLLTHLFDGNIDLLLFDVEPAASSAVFPIAVTTPTLRVERQMEVHDRAEVTRIDLVSRDLPLEDSQFPAGTVLAEVYAKKDRMIGARVTFSSPTDAPAEGTLVRWRDEGGTPTQLTACFDSVCETIEIPGAIVEITDGLPSAEACGCANAGPRLPLSWGALAAWLAISVVRVRSRV